MGAQNEKLAHSQGGQQNRSKKKAGGSWLLVVLPVLIILLLITSVLLGMRLYESATRDQHAVQLTVGETGQVELFKVEYENETGDVTVSGAGDDQVVAPGTSVDYEVRLTNDDDTHIDYVFVGNAKFLTDDDVPIEVRLIDPYGNYLLGGVEEWASIEDINNIAHRGVVREDELVTYTFSWKWEYEDGVSTDSYDTYLGNGGALAMPGVEVSFAAESSASVKLPHTEGSLFHGLSDWGCCICCFLVWVLIVLCGITLFYIWRQHKTIDKLNEGLEGQSLGQGGGE